MTGDSEEKKGHTPGPWKLGSRVGEKNCFVEINGSGWVALATVPAWAEKVADAHGFAGLLTKAELEEAQ